MQEQDSQRSYKDRVAACPIHQWADVDMYLNMLFTPSHLIKPFHEIILARGEYPKRISKAGDNMFLEQVDKIEKEYELSEYDMDTLEGVFYPLIIEWISSSAVLN